MKQYLGIIQDILDNGIKREDRTGVGTLSIFGTQNRYDLSTGKFPLLTTKKLFTRGIIEELLFFIAGDTNIEHLEEKNVNIWSAWKDPEGKKYPPYGAMWRRWPKNPRPGKIDIWAKEKNYYVDQLANVIEEIKTNPGSRRLIVNAWNPGEMDNFVLPPCHAFYQFYVREEFLDLQLYVRSNDVFLGMPFNIASYALLLMMVAQVTGYKPGTLVYTTGDTHLYLNHIEQAKLQLSREPRELPVMTINPEVKNIEDFKLEDFVLTGYDPWPHIKAEVAV